MYIFAYVQLLKEAVGKFLCKTSDVVLVKVSREQKYEHSLHL